MGWLKKQAKKVGHAVEKTVNKVTDTVSETLKDTYHAVDETVRGVGHEIAGHHEAAGEHFEKAISNATQAGLNIGTAGAAQIVSPKLLDKAGETAGELGVKVGEAFTKPMVAPVEGTYHLGKAGYYLASGDTSKAQENFAKGVGDFAKGMTGGTVNLLFPELSKTLETGGKMLAYYGTGNFNRGSDQLEKLTGWDVDNSIAEAAERAARAAYQAEVDAANAAAERNRRANLLSLRKSLTPTLNRASQGGQGGAGSQIKGIGGIVLG